jgi:hypothetical protein
MDFVKFLEKNQKLHKIKKSNHSGHSEGDIMQNHEQKKKVKKSGKPRFYGQKILFS